MKVICEGNDTVDVSEIQSVSVITASKPIEVRVEYQTKKTSKQKFCDLAQPRTNYSLSNWPKSVEVIVNELEDLSKSPDTSIEQVVKLTAWALGYLQAKLDINSHASVQGLARLAWYWPLGRIPKDEEWELRTGLSADKIEKIAGTDIYKQSIKALMLETYNTPDKFKWWLRDHGRNVPRWLGKRLRLREDTVTKLINSVAEQYGIDLGNLKSSSAFFESERTIGSGNQSVYLYYYRWDRENAASNGLNVWECKIGKTERSLQARLKEQTRDPENFKLGLHIKTDRPKEIEDIIHDELKKRGKHISESPRTEWFVTSPSEIEEIYNFIGERSRKSASGK